MRAGNPCKKSLSLRKFSLSVLGIFLLIACLVTPVAAVKLWDITVVDSTGKVGLYTSLAILPSGQPAIGYYDYTNRDLKYAWYDGSIFQTTTVDSSGSVGAYTSIAILPSGYPAISYYDNSNRDLKYAWFDGNSWQITTVQSDGDVGRFSSLAILPSGYPAISYYDETNKNLKYASFNGSAWQSTTVDSTGNAYQFISLAILGSGQPAISYEDYNPNSELKYAWYDGSAWQTTTIDTVGSGGGENSLAILPSGHPAISYEANYDLKYAWNDGSTWHTVNVDGSGGSRNSLAILPSGQPAISCRGLDYVWYDGSAWHRIHVDSVWGMGYYTSLDILPSGQPAISYYDENNGDLRFATPASIPAAPVAMPASYTATAWTGYGGTTTVTDGPAYSSGYSGGDIMPAASYSSVSLETTNEGQLRAVIDLSGTDGEMWGEAIPAGDANGTIMGTLALGTSESYPSGSELELYMEIITGGLTSDVEDYHLQLWRSASLLAQIDPSAPDSITVTVLAGETLTFELFASEDDLSGESNDRYDRYFDFRLILRGPTNFDGKGSVDFRDYAIFGLHWLDVGCIDPTWCGKTDLDKSSDVNLPDLKIFTDHWLE